MERPCEALVDADEFIFIPGMALGVEIGGHVDGVEVQLRGTKRRKSKVELCLILASKGKRWHWIAKDGNMRLCFARISRCARKPSYSLVSTQKVESALSPRILGCSATLTLAVC
jgi:hypothetical protein